MVENRRFLGHLLRDDLINAVKMSFREYVRPYVRNETQRSHKPNSLVVFVKVDETFTKMTFKVIRGQGQGLEITSVPFWDYFYLYHLHLPLEVGLLSQKFCPQN